MRKINQIGFDLIKRFEGCKLKAYRCPAGVLTIGYGHTQNVRDDDVISMTDANILLSKDLERFERYVEAFSEKYDYFLNDNEFSALVSFAFNCGCDNVRRLSDSGRRSKTKIAEAMLRYNKANGKVLAGLTKRRQAEHDLFLSPCDKLKDDDENKYYPIPSIDSVSIVEMLANINVDYSYKHRKAIALKNGILNYTGTPSQNLLMIKALKQGALIKG